MGKTARKIDLLAETANNHNLALQAIKGRFDRAWERLDALEKAASVAEKGIKRLGIRLKGLERKVYQLPEGVEVAEPEGTDG
jgi:hypothetical protein